jgi:hypothetical protein
VKKSNSYNNNNNNNIYIIKEKSVLKGKAPLALSTRAWVRPDAISSWNKDNFGNLTLVRL